MKNLRKYKRKKTDIDVKFMDKTQSTGKMVDASREGSLVIVSDKLKPINAFVTFTIELEQGKSIKLVGKVIRHTKIDNKDAMGVEFLELGSQDLTHWLDLLEKTPQDDQAIMVRAINQDSPQNPYPSFTLRFQSMDKLNNFFPSPITAPFYFSTSVEIPQDDMINIVLVHPEREDIFEFVAIVIRYGPHPQKKNRKGLYCIIDDTSEEFQASLKRFL